MPKLKTHKATTKRFSMTKNGKIMRKGAGSSHLLSTKTAKRKRGLRRTQPVRGADARRVRRILSR